METDCNVADNNAKQHQWPEKNKLFEIDSETVKIMGDAS